MRLLKYSDWADTAQIIHMIVQMMGKVKLAKMPPQPEWGHVLLYPTAQGFTTGLIMNGDKSFDIALNLNTSMVYSHCTDGGVAGFPLRNNTSVSEYYEDFQRMLKEVAGRIPINPIPQEVANTTPFDEQTDKKDYDYESAGVYFQECIFARNALLDFASGFRGKIILPALFWGTFDMTTVLFSGEEEPFDGQGLVEEAAFDEKFVEFGFWPGDSAVDDPSFFILHYPFVERDYSGTGIQPKEAYFSTKKKEFFLSLSDAIKYDDPHQEVVRFCRGALESLMEKEKWQRKEWFTKPLLIYTNSI